MNDTLLEKFESYGGFWLPDAPDGMVSGQLKFDPDGSFELILSESFDTGTDSIALLQSKKRIPVILGQLVNGRLVTLLDALPSQHLFGFGPGGPSTILPYLALLGIHCRSLDDLPIITFQTSFTLLEQWATHTKISSEFAMEADGVTKKEWLIHCGFPPDETFEVAAASTSVTLCQQLDSDCGRTEFTVRPVSFFQVEPVSPVSLEIVKALQWNLQNLITLLTGYAVAPRFLHLEIDKPDERLKTPTTSVETLCLLTLKNPQRNRFTEQMLIPFSTIKPQFKSILNQWFSVVEQSKVALDVCFGSLYQPAPVLNLRFLAIMQAIETYHRSSGAGEYMDAAAYKSVIDKYVQQLPMEIQGSHRDSLKKRLQYGNEYSQRKRFNLLIDALPEDLQDAIVLSRAEFVAYAVDTRNQFTHYNSNPEGKILNGGEVYWMSERLRWLLNATILVDIGIDGNALLNILNQNSSFREAIYSEMPFKCKKHGL